MLTLSEFTEEIASFVGSSDETAIARGVAARLPALLANPHVLAPEHRAPGEDRYRQHLLHVDPAGRFSVLALVWQPGQETPPHDHVAWCVVGVYEGEERETAYGLRGERELVATATWIHGPGDVTYLLPSECNIHRVDNPGATTAISIHVYGADIARLGSSVRERY